MSGTTRGGIDYTEKPHAEARKQWAGFYATHPSGTPKFAGGSALNAPFHQARLMIPLPSKARFRNIKTVLRSNDIAERIFDTVGVSKTSLTNLQTGQQESVSGVDSSTEDFGGLGYVDFMLQSFTTQFSELHQVMDLLSDAYAAYFHGQRAPRCSLQGLVLNTRENNWLDQFYELYQYIIRGSRLARFRVPAVLRVDSRLFYVAFTDASISFNGATETSAQFSMNGIIRRIDLIENAKNNNLPTDLRDIAYITQLLIAQNVLNVLRDGAVATVAAVTDVANRTAAGFSEIGTAFDRTIGVAPNSAVGQVGQLINETVGAITRLPTTEDVVRGASRAVARARTSATSNLVVSSTNSGSASHRQEQERVRNLLRETLP